MLLAYHKGSPPPMRGKVSFVSAVVICGGITPAYAGKSDNEGGRCQLRRDHPRLCGEKPSPAKRNCYKTGSPPPMRGKVCETMKFIPSSRITPAYAGKRRLRLDRSTADGDHPRLCGEKMSLQKTAKRMQGSPPPMRGKEYNGRLFNACYRITPAYAGKRVELHAGK